MNEPLIDADTLRFAADQPEVYDLRMVLTRAADQLDRSRQLADYAGQQHDALERARGCIKGLLARTPVRDVSETLAEIDAVLAKNPNAEGKEVANAGFDSATTVEAGDAHPLPRAECGHETRDHPRECPTCGGTNPAWHPAVQAGGEVHLCEDSWHQPTAAEIREREAAERLQSGTKENEMPNVHEWVQGYEFRFDEGGGYTPTEQERAMLEDAINGYLGDSLPQVGKPDAVLLRDALERAEGWLVNAHHGDNCFLTDDPPEFNRCYCGRDGLIDYIQAVLERTVAGDKP
jgi:hypothetical protein